PAEAAQPTGGGRQGNAGGHGGRAHARRRRPRGHEPGRLHRAPPRRGERAVSTAVFFNIWRSFSLIALERSQRINREITAPEVRLVAENGDQLGIQPVAEALRMAEEKNVDLVEIAPLANPPVCKLMDYGKFRYREQKKAHEAKLKQKQIQAIGIQVLSDALEQALAEFLVGHLAPAKAQSHFRLVALLEELDQLSQLDLVVAFVGARSELDFLDLDLLLLELRFVRLLLLAVAELAVIHQLADRRIGERRDLHQVHVFLLCHPQGLGDGLDAELFTVFR